MDKHITRNTQIKKCGLAFLGKGTSRFILSDDATWSLEIPLDRIKDLIKLFPEISWQNGQYLNKIKNSYLRLIMNEHSDILGLEHIIKDDLCYIIDIESKENNKPCDNCKYKNGDTPHTCDICTRLDEEKYCMWEHEGGQ